MAINKITEVLIQFVPTFEFSKTPKGRQASAVFTLPADMPLPEVGEFVRFGGSDDSFKIMARSFGFPSFSGEGQTVQIFFGIELVKDR